MKKLSLSLLVLLLNITTLTFGIVPATQIKAGYCGRTDYIRNSELWADAVTGATQYEFQISDAADAIVIATRMQSSAKLILSQVTPALQWNTQYNVRVRAFIGVDAGTFGSPCLIGLIPNPSTTMPTTSLISSSCNASGLSLSDFIYAQQVPGATHYKFEFTNTGSGVVITREVTSYFIKLNNTIPLLTNPGNYDVRVAVRFSTLYTGSYSSTCPISIGPGPANIPSTKLTTTFCGATGLGLNSAIQANGVSAATQYEFEFRTISTNSLVAIKLNNTRTIALNSIIPSLQWNTSYNVRVRAYRGISSGPYGAACSISLIADPSTSVPSTSLNSASCGATNLTPYSTINAASVAGATQYLFTFTQGGSPYATFTSSNAICNLTSVSPAIAWNSTYSVTVQASVGGIQGSPGLPCSISTIPDPAIVGVPDTRLNDAACGNLNLDITSVIGATGVFGATLYDFHFYDPANLTNTYAEINQNSNSLPVINISPALQPNVTYTVYVRAKIGNLFGNFSTACSIRIIGVSPARQEKEEISNVVAENLSDKVLQIFPNPSDGLLQISTGVSASEVLSISIIDLTGKIAFEEQVTTGGIIALNPDISSGLYLIKISDRHGIRHQQKWLKK